MAPRRGIVNHNSICLLVSPEQKCAVMKAANSSNSHFYLFHHVTSAWSPVECPSRAHTHPLPHPTVAIGVTVTFWGTGTDRLVRWTHVLHPPTFDRRWAVLRNQNCLLQFGDRKTCRYRGGGSTKGQSCTLRKTGHQMSDYVTDWTTFLS